MKNGLQTKRVVWIESGGMLKAVYRPIAHRQKQSEQFNQAVGRKILEARLRRIEARKAILDWAKQR